MDWRDVFVALAAAGPADAYYDEPLGGTLYRRHSLDGRACLAVAYEPWPGEFFAAEVLGAA